MTEPQTDAPQTDDSQVDAPSEQGEDKPEMEAPPVKKDEIRIHDEVEGVRLGSLEGVWYVEWTAQDRVFKCADSTAATELFKFLRKWSGRLAIM